MTYVMNRVGNGIEWTLTGEVTFEEVMEAHNEMWKLPDFERLRFQVVDMLGVTNVLMETGYATAIGFMEQAAANFGSHMRVALVGTAPTVVEAFKAYVAAFDHANAEARMFDNLIDARNWASGKVE